MPTRLAYVPGQRFGRLVLLSFEGKRWRCQCDFGVTGSNVTAVVVGKTWT